MDSSDIWRPILLIAVLLILSAYFSATETAFTSLNRIRMKNRADDGDKRAKRVLRLEEDYDDLLTTILIGNNLVNIATTAVATVLFVKLYGEYGPTIATVVVTIIVLIFGEITPKSLAKEHSESFALFSSPVIQLLKIIFFPFCWLFRQWQKLMALIFRAKGDDGITPDELLTIVEEAEDSGGINQKQSQLIQNAINFDTLDAMDMLTPRVEVKAIELGSPKEEIDRVFLESGFSRLPVFEDDLDGILGVLNVRDFHDHILGKRARVVDYIKPVIYVAGSMKAPELLRKLQENKCRMAIIVDEYGGTEGIVTTEDIIEELVGEINDESDTVASQEITPLQNGSYRVLGGANLEKMFDHFDEEAEVDAATVNGWVMIQLDRLPKEGDKFEYALGEKLFKVRVTKADGRRATEINLRVADNPALTESR